METAIVIFLNKNTNFKVEIEIPLNITANDLIYALNKAFDLELNSEDIFDCYLVSENPIAFLKGNRELKEYGLRNGSCIIYKRG